MDESHQIDIPESFIALYRPPGKLKPSLPLQALVARYEWCEDMARMLSETLPEQQFQRGISESQALSHCLAGLMLEPAVLNGDEAQWVVRRLAELLQWPEPQAR